MLKDNQVKERSLNWGVNLNKQSLNKQAQKRFKFRISRHPDHPVLFSEVILVIIVNKEK